MSGRWIEVRSYGTEMEASIARDILENEGVPVEVRVDGGPWYGHLLGGVTGWRLAVPEDAAETALELLAEGDEEDAGEE